MATQSEVEDVVKKVEVELSILVFVKFNLVNLIVGANENAQGVEIVFVKSDVNGRGTEGT